MDTAAESTHSRPSSNAGAQAFPYRDRLPPQDLEAEQALLGSMMLHRDALGDVLPLIPRSESDRLYRGDHRKLFEVIVDMGDRGDPIDLVTLRNELEKRHLLQEVGGVDYLVQLAESVPSHLHAEHYARIVRDKSMLRELILSASRMMEDAYEQGDEAQKIVDRAEQLLFHVAEQRITQQPTQLQIYLHEVFRQIESREGHYITGAPTGFVELDDLLSGMQAGEMIIVAARPSMGKTAFGLSIAEHMVSRANKSVAFFSLEMSKQAIAQRILCARARVDSHRLRRGMLGDQEIALLQSVVQELETCSMYVDDTPGMSVLELRAKARRLKARYNIDAVFVDYIQLMTCSIRVDNRQQEVAEISRGLKALARELNIPIVVMAQLNRNPEGRTDFKPRMSDLRESGAIEQDADVVLLLHREEYYKRENCPEDLKNVAEVIIAKQRNGPVGTVKLFFNQALTRFDNLRIEGEPGYQVPSSVYSNDGPGLAREEPPLPRAEPALSRYQSSPPRYEQSASGEEPGSGPDEPAPF